MSAPMHLTSQSLPVESKKLDLPSLHEVAKGNHHSQRQNHFWNLKTSFWSVTRWFVQELFPSQCPGCGMSWSETVSMEPCQFGSFRKRRERYVKIQDWKYTSVATNQRLVPSLNDHSSYFRNCLFSLLDVRYLFAKDL